MKLDNRGNWSLIGLLAAVVVIGLVGYFYFAGGGGTSTVREDSELVDQSSEKQTVYGKAMDKAKGTDCQERLRQIRAGIANYEITNEAKPPTMKDIGLGVSTDYFNCPVNGRAYNYDPNTGVVSCPYAGHAGY